MEYIIEDGSGHSTIIEVIKRETKEQILAEYIALRKEMGLSQEDVAKLTGIARPNISRIENGKFDPTLEVLTKLASALNRKLEIHFVEK